MRGNPEKGLRNSHFFEKGAGYLYIILNGLFAYLYASPLSSSRQSKPQNSKTMAAETSKSIASVLLLLNLLLYFLAIVVASWAINHGIELSHETASVLSLPARIFPIYFPVGNMATGFFVIFSLLAGIVGFTTSLTGIHSIVQGTATGIHTAAASSLATWALTLLAMGLACKEINIGWTDSNLRTLETLMIILSGTQLLCTGAIHAGVEDTRNACRL